MSIASTIQKFGETIEVKRFNAGYQLGNQFVDGGFRLFSMFASVQPVSGDDLVNEPSGQRTSDQIKIYTHAPLKTNDEKNKVKADIITWRGDRYEVQNVSNWTILNLKHYKSIAKRLINT